MRILLVDLKFYPSAYFFDLDIWINIEEYDLYDEGDFEKTYFKTYFEIPEYSLYGYECYHDLLFDLSKKLGYDNFKIVYKL